MSAWTSALKISRKIVLGLMVLVVLWWLYRIVARLMKPSTKTEIVDFDVADSVTWTAKAGHVTELESDKTVDAALSGMFGPCVLQFYAEWCHHCKNMESDFAAAAAAAQIPFVRVHGSKTPISNRKHAVGGYPTIFGVSTHNAAAGPRRYNGQRTKDSFLEFANALGPVGPVGPMGPVAVGPAVGPSGPAVVATGPPVVSAYVPQVMPPSFIPMPALPSVNVGAGTGLGQP